MYNSMMDPELIKIAQEQMSRISPAEFARIQQQMMANPELIRVASESMKNMRPEDLRNAAEQLKYTRPEDMAELGHKMANASPEEIASLRARADAHASYGLNAAEMLKKQGNELHQKGRFSDALQKYLLAKKNLEGISSSKGRLLLLACSLNLMSCYLKTRQYNECVEEGSEVLAYDAKNIKALYRRGQAYKELGCLEDAVSDLSKAHEISPDDETVEGELRHAKEILAKEGGGHASRGLIIEEITEEVDAVSSENHMSSSTNASIIEKQETIGCPQNQVKTNSGTPGQNSVCVQAVKDGPEVARSFQDFFSKADADTLAAMSAGKAGESPDMFKAASNMISKMSPEELQKMLQLASSFQGENSLSQGSSDTPNGFRSGLVPPNVSSDMLKTASDMMGKLSYEERQKMFEMAARLKGNASVSAEANPSGLGASSKFRSTFFENENNSAVDGNILNGESSSSHGLSSNFGSTLSQSSDLQEHMRNSMNDPAVRQMMTSMIKNMNPDMMANMSEQFGFKLSREDAEKAQQAMSSLSPEALDKMMRWMERAQKAVECGKKMKNWVLGRPGMILALLMLILAIFLHRLGYIGG